MPGRAAVGSGGTTSATGSDETCSRMVKKWCECGRFGRQTRREAVREESNREHWWEKRAWLEAGRRESDRGEVSGGWGKGGRGEGWEGRRFVHLSHDISGSAAL